MLLFFYGEITKFDPCETVYIPPVFIVHMQINKFMIVHRQINKFMKKKKEKRRFSQEEAILKCSNWSFGIPVNSDLIRDRLLNITNYSRPGMLKVATVTLRLQSMVSLRDTISV